MRAGRSAVRPAINLAAARPRFGGMIQRTRGRAAGVLLIAVATAAWGVSAYALAAVAGYARLP